MVVVVVAVLDRQGVSGPATIRLMKLVVRLLVHRLRTRLDLDILLDTAFGVPIHRSLGRMEDDDVADLRVTEVVAHAVDQHPLTDVQGRLHRPGGDLVRLDEKGLDQERQPDRKRHDHHELDERSAARGGFRDQRIQPLVRVSSAPSSSEPSASPSGSSDDSAPATPSSSAVTSASSLAAGCSSGPSTASSLAASSSSGSTTSGSASLCATPSESTASASSVVSTRSSSMPHRRSATRARFPTRPRR